MGESSYTKLADIDQWYDSRRIFVVLDPALAGGEYFSNIQRVLENSDVRVAIFSEIEPDPNTTVVSRAHQACQEHEATVLLAIGGGSTIDIAKAVCILATNGGRIHDYEGVDKFSTPPLPLIAIPTTAGTGSEVSGSCVITDEKLNLKMSIRHASLNPARIAILDPLALRTMPAHVAVHSGIDAFVHAFESFLSLRSNPVTDALNLQAISFISNNIRPFVANRSNSHAGLNMLYGSTLAGITFGQTGLGNVHCMARFIGTFFNLSHGLSNGLCLPHVARFNLIANPEKYSKVAAAMGLPVQGINTLDAAHMALEGVERLCKDLGIPLRMREAGVTQDKFDEIARLCADANYSRWNPRTTSEREFRQLLDVAY